MSSTLVIANPNDLTLAWRTPYVSEGVNRKGINDSRGIVRGFDVMPDYANPGQIYLMVDYFLGDSVINSVTSDGKYSITYRVTSNIILSFVATGKYWIAFRPTYTVSSATTAEIVAYTEAEINSGVHVNDRSIMICALDYQSLGVIAFPWIMYFGTTTSNKNWQRTLQERNRGEHGRRDISIIYHDDFRYPARWNLSGDLNRLIDYDDYATGCCALKLSHPGAGAPRAFYATKNSWKTARSVSRALKPSRFIVEYVYKTSSGFNPSSNTGIDLEFVLYDRVSSNKYKVLASSLTGSECPGFKWITNVSTSFKTIRFEVMEPMSNPDRYVTGVRALVNADLVSGDIWFDSLRIYQNVPFAVGMGEPDTSYNLGDMFATTIRLFDAGSTVPSSYNIETQEGFVIDASNDLGVFDMLSIEPPTEIESGIVIGKPNADCKYRFVGHSGRPSGRKNFEIVTLDLKITDGRLLLPSESNFGAMICDAPPVVPGGVIGFFRGNFNGVVDTSFNLNVADDISGTGIRCAFINHDVDGNVVGDNAYVVVFSIGDWTSAGVTAPVSGYVDYVNPAYFVIYLFDRTGAPVDPYDGSISKYLNISIMAFRSTDIPTWT